MDADDHRHPPVGVSEGGGSPSPRKLTTEVALAFGFGVTFVVLIVVIALVRPNPTNFEYTVFRIVIALAAAGVAAVVPGFLDVSFKNWLRAGGALAVFVIVYFFAPVTSTPSEGAVVDEPTADAKLDADAWLALVDAGNYTAAYASMADGFKSRYPYSMVDDLLTRTRRSLGTVKARSFTGGTPYESPPGLPKGAYRDYWFRTTFEKSTQELFEIISLSAEDGAWKVFGFHMAWRTESGQLVPYDPP